MQKGENIMATPVKKSNVVHLWRCTHCGRTSSSSVKPLMTSGGKCSKASNGLHRWVKER